MNNQPLPFFSILLFLIFFTSTLFGQRYLVDVFEEVDTFTYIYAKKNGEELGLDLYLPANDTLKSRPLLIYVHGGGFSGGVRDGKYTKDFCKKIARKGYAVVSMSYVLTMKGQSFSCDQPSPNKVSTFQSVVQDIRDATIFLLEKAEKHQLDPANFVLSGSSAGAEAIVHAAYWKEEHLPEGTTLLPSNFRYAGIISMAGAIVDLKLISKETAIPSQFFHGTCDNLVPYATAPHHYCDPGKTGYLILHGAKSMAERLEHLGKPYFLLTSCGGNHSWAGKPMYQEVNSILDFLYHDVLGGKFRQIHHVIQEDGACDYFEEPFNFCGN